MIVSSTLGCFFFSSSLDSSSETREALLEFVSDSMSSLMAVYSFFFFLGDAFSIDDFFFSSFLSPGLSSFCPPHEKFDL